MKRRLLILALAVVFGLASQALAAKGGGGKGGGGGGEDPEPSGPLVVELDTAEGVVLDINELSTIVDEATGEIVEGVEAVGRLDGFPVQSGMYWRVDAEGNVLESVELAAGADATEAMAINNSGAIVGWGRQILDDSVPWEDQVWFVWPLLWKERNADPIVLPVPDGYNARATSINDDNIVVGVIWKDSSYEVIAWKIDISGETPVVEDWITFLPATAAEVHLRSLPNPSIADTGIGVTTVFTDLSADGFRFNLSFDGEVLTVDNVESLFGDAPFNSEAVAVNDSGAVVGHLGGGDAYVLDGDGIPVPLETLPRERIKGNWIEYAPQYAGAINNLGVSVGNLHGARVDTGSLYTNFRAMWDASGNLTLLPDDWSASGDINDDGWIGGGFRLWEPTLRRVPAILIPSQ